DYVYFIVDGLEDIPPADQTTRSQILELIPFGYSEFRFVLSARSADDLALNPRAHQLAKVYTAVHFFSPEETSRYLADLGLTSAQLAEVQKATQNFPGKLASIRRLLRTGRDPDVLLANLPDELPGLFDLEWSEVDATDS